MFKEDFYWTMIHNAPIGYALYKVVYDTAGKLNDLQFIEINQEFSRLTGWSDDIVIHRTITEMLPGSRESAFDWVNFCAQVQQSQRPVEYVQYFSLLDRWFKGCIYTPEADYLITLFYDISDEQRMEAENASLISSVFDIIIDLDHELRIARVFTGNDSLLLRPHQDIIGLNIHDLWLNSEIISIFNRAYVAASSTNTRQTVEYKAASEERWFRASIQPLSGKLPFRVVIREITEQKKAEGILQTFFAVASDYLCILDKDGHFIEVNLAFNRQVGLDVANKTFVDFVHPEDQDLVARAITDLLEGRPKGKLLFRVRFVDSAWHYIEVRATAYNGLIYTAGRDITEELTKAQEVERDNTRLSMLVDLLQHSFTTYHELVDFALMQGLSLTSSQYGSFYSYDAAQNELNLISHTPSVEAECQIKHKRLQGYHVADSGAWTHPIIDGKPHFINDYQSPHPHKKGYPEGHLRIDRFLSVPVYSSEGLKALVIMANKETPYTDRDAIQLTLFMNTVWQVGEHKRAELALQQEKEWVKVTLEALGEGVISTDNQGRIVVLNKVAEKLTGWPTAAARGRMVDEVLQVTSINNLTGPRLVNQVLSANQPVEAKSPVIMKSRDHTERLISQRAAPIRDADGSLLGVVLVFQDVTLEYRKKQRIMYLMQHDKLTGLYNREFIEQELGRLEAEKKIPLSIVMGDVNALKLTNDAFGHEAGDRLLVQTAAVLKSCCRPEDIVARWGGDEFIIILPGMNHEEAHMVCRRIREQFSNMDEGLGSISLGYATKENSHQHLRDVLTEAENYMYRRKLLESKSLRSSLISSITHTLDEKSHETEAHARRIREKCKEIGLAMGLREHQINELELLSMLHDIGKIAVNDHILNKPAPLTEDEWQVMQRHPEVGYRITQLVPELSIVADHILCHHERWDGTGYPQGLERDDIPLPARILAVVDAYDAMTNDRPYRKAMTKEQARREISKGAGTQFDPEVVEAFLGLSPPTAEVIRISAKFI